MSQTRDWYRWHAPYADPSSPLSQRLALVRRHIGAWLDARPDPRLTVLSVCAGQGLDLLGVLAGRADAARVHGALVELDPRNTAPAEEAVHAAGLTGITVRQADAGDVAVYADLVPADLVLLVGVFGNIGDDDVRGTIETLPHLCAAGATVIWTRHRDEPDMNPTIRAWFTAAGFAEEAFHAPDGVRFTVGVNRFTGLPQPALRHGTLFTFIR